ncbi:D-alanyl-D-alanine carboxypeptidase [compost metagenome]
MQRLTAPSTEPVPPVSSGGGSGPVLGVGHSGQAVTAMQQRLKDLGIDPGPIDGVFGPMTQVAVKTFQQQQGITVDGVVGPETWGKLGIHVAAPEPVPADSKPSAGTFKEAANPADLVSLQGFQMLKGTAEAFGAMQAAARADGVDLSITSAYRSDAYQAGLFKNAVAKYGSEAAASKWVAPPGNSQHRSGRALDLELSGGVHAWLSKNAARFGFYQPMSWEDWHWTYTGKARGSQG